MSRTFKRFAVLAILALLVAVGIYATDSQASVDPQEAATQAAQEYLAGIEKGDVQAILAHVKDTRHPDQAERVKAYERYIKSEKADHTKLKFVSVEAAGADRFTFHFEITSDRIPTEKVALPVIRDEDGAWKVLVDGSVNIGKYAH